MAIFKLRNKIMIRLLATTVLFGLGLVVFTETFIHNKLHNLLLEKGIALAENVAADCVKPVITEQYFEITMLFRDLILSDKELLYAYVLNEDGRALAHTFPDEIPQELKMAHKIDPTKQYSFKNILTDKGTAIDIAVPLLGGQIGELHLGLSDVVISKDINDIVFSIILFSVFMLILKIAIWLMFANTVTKPLAKLSESAEAFGRGEMNHPISIYSNDEIGVLANSFNAMMVHREQQKSEREKLILELREALNNVKTLSGMLPICASCKKIRDDKGYWSQIEYYISTHSDAEFSHGICPDCAQKLYPDIWERIKDEEK